MRNLIYIKSFRQLIQKRCNFVIQPLDRSRVLNHCLAKYVSDKTGEDVCIELFPLQKKKISPCAESI